MGLFKIRDINHGAENTGARVIADLDALIAEPVAFRFQGKSHLIKPISTAEFLKFLEASAKIGEVIVDKSAKPADIITAYHRLISSVCDTFTRRDVELMTEAQSWALFRVIVETVKGKPHDEESKKKLMEMGRKIQGQP